LTTENKHFEEKFQYTALIPLTFCRFYRESKRGETEHITECIKFFPLAKSELTTEPQRTQRKFIFSDRGDDRSKKALNPPGLFLNSVYAEGVTIFICRYLPANKRSLTPSVNSVPQAQRVVKPFIVMQPILRTW